MSDLVGWDGSTPLLGDEEVHVWSIALDGDVQEADSLLSRDERARAARLCSPGLRNRFALARAAMRRVLGLYLGADPASLTIEQGEYGKPFLRDDRLLHFNISHSEALAVLAVTRMSEVGIDVERLRFVEDLRALLQRWIDLAK